MKIRFEKVGRTPRPFAQRIGEIDLSGTLHKLQMHRIGLEGRLSGRLRLVCDRCGAPVNIEVHAPLKLTIYDRVSDDNEDLDSIEFLDGEIDLAYILQSEITALERGEYHYCEACLERSDALQIEF
jgi:uncharacterized metal-binding protein YceD (DUF177 family)